MYYEYRIRKISDNGSLPSVEFLLLMIYKHLLILGIDMQPGFKSEQIQEKIRETLPEIPDGLYLRVNDLMEKYFYGGEPLEEYEIRLVHQFLLKLRDSRKKMGILTGSVSATAFSVDLHLRMNYNMKDYIGII